MAKEYEVSHGTLRRALDSLTREHKLTRYQGKGTAVALLDSDQALFKFFQIHREDGVCPLPTSMNIRVTRGSGERDGATGKEADALNMEVGDDVIRIRRLRIVDNLPLFNEYITVPHRLFRGLDDEPLESIPNTLYDYYQRKYNVTISRARELVSAVGASAEDARRLSIEAGKPILRVERIAYDITDRPVEYRITHMLTQGYYYYTELGG